MIRLYSVFAILVFTPLSFLSCVEPFDFKETAFESVLVVDGFITNLPGPYSIHLSTTSPVDSETYFPVSNAKVSVKDNQNNEYVFLESADGEYVSPQNFQGVVGSSYQLLLEIEDKNYQSDLILLRNTEPMDSIHGIVSRRLVGENNTSELGVQFFVNTTVSSATPGYYRYEWEETYRINTPFGSLLKYNVEDSSFAFRDTLIGRCYSYGSSESLLVATSNESSNNRVENFPIRFISSEQQALRSRYSILVKQYSISPEAYNFYRQIQKNSQSGGSLIDRQLGTIVGNVKSTTDPEETVLGYFEVAGASELRDFFVPAQFDGYTNSNFPFLCSFGDLINVGLDSLAIFLERDPDLLIYTYNDEEFFFQLAPRVCSDCSWYADVIKPDFWID